MIRVTPEEKKRLENLCKIDCCSTLTEWCRRKLFQSISVDYRLNEILDLLKEKKEEKNVRGK